MVMVSLPFMLRRPFKKIKNEIIYISVRFIIVLCRLLPISLGANIIRLIGYCFSVLPLRENKIAMKNLLNYYKEDEAKRIFYLMYSHFSDSVVEMVRVLIKKEKVESLSEIDRESIGILREALLEKRGVIFFTGHIGNWEIMAMTLARYGFDINTIARESYDPRFTAMIRSFRESNGVKCIFRNEENIRSRILEVLKRNGVMGFLIDQNTKVMSSDVNFLDRPAPTPIMPVKILKMSGANAVVGVNHREGGKIVIEIKRVDYSPQEDDLIILNRINDLLSGYIKRYPHQWIWVHDRWKLSG